MAHLRSRRRTALTVPLGIALAASVGLVPGAATAAPDESPAPAVASAAKDAPVFAYVVNTRADHRTMAYVKRAIAEAGGSVVVAHDTIGVIVAHSSDPAFGERIRGVRGVQSAGATHTAPLRAAGTTDDGKAELLSKADAEALKRTAAPGVEPMEGDQWDLRAIGADKAARINPGSRKVTVAVIDTGVDDTHPDLAPNFSAAQSASCVGGKADTSAGAWRPANKDHYHGTHVAGEIAAARNGVGVAGVAPGVKIAGIKVADPVDELFYPENVVCAFVFAADHGVEITNNSYYVDPWLYNCKDDPDQRAILDAVNRAQLYAQRKGTLNVASAGNSNHDLDSHAIVDKTSPDDSTPVTRTIDPHECLDAPAQLPGIVTTSATGFKTLKAAYSSYGKGVVDITAPGGDKYQTPTDTPSKNGNILSTMPNGEYGWLRGTSMAAPHAAGVAALLKSTHPKAGPAQLRGLLKAQADRMECPAEPYDPDSDGDVDAVCENGGKGDNGFYGSGLVDALDAVKKK